MNFADFIAPFDETRFMAENFDRSPLHVSAKGRVAQRGELACSARFFEWLELAGQWQAGRLKLIMDSRPVGTEHYCVVREAAEGPLVRPDRALVESMMALGASAVANGVEDVSADIRRCCAMLGRRFGAKSGANVYVSHAGVQAFASHCDPHEVFAVQCEGRKTWRIYEARAEVPTEATLLQDQAHIDRVKGRVLMEIAMEPGDLLYIPRGYYHDAVAQEGRSMHLTFAVQPLYGIGVLEMLRDLALERPEMRNYLPPAEDDERLRKQLSAIGREIAALLGSRAFFEDIAVKQRTIASPIAPAPDPAVTLLVRTALRCEVVQPLDGSFVLIGGARREIGFLSDAARWIFAHKAFTRAQCTARFCHHPAEEIDTLLNDLLHLGALEEHPISA